MNKSTKPRKLTEYCFQRLVTGFLCIAMLVCGLVGCAGKTQEADGGHLQKGEDEKVKVILSTGFQEDELFKLETSVCYLPEALIYLVNLQNRYEAVYGTEIWQKSINGVSLADNIKEITLADLSQIKAMVLMAEARGVELNSDEKEKAELAAMEYYDSLNEAEIEFMQASVDILISMYEDYALSNKVYDEIIKNINPEISDDEARNITVEYILLKTYTEDGTGKRIDYSEESRKETYEKALSIWEEAIKDGSDFEELILLYNEDDRSVCSFGKGEEDFRFEAAAFNLGTNEISKVVEIDDGYAIIKCLNTFERSETDANKIKIVEEKRREVFGEEYDGFIENLTKDMNTELWENVSLHSDSAIKTKSFFDVYERYFS